MTDSFMAGVLSRLGYGQNPAVIAALSALARVESPEQLRAVNPLDTTQSEGEGIRLNTSYQGPRPGWWNSVGVRYYADPESGMNATAKTLTNGYYRNWLRVLQTGVWDEAARSDMHKWGFNDNQINVFTKALKGGGATVTQPFSGASNPTLSQAPPGAGAGTPITGTVLPENLRPVYGPNGSIIGYERLDEFGRVVVRYTPQELANLQQYGSLDVPDQDKPREAPLDSPADTMNAYSARMNALSNQLAGLSAFYDTMVSTGKLSSEDAWKRYEAEVAAIQAEQDTLWNNAQTAFNQGTLDLQRGQLALNTATDEETARRQREIEEANRRLGVAEEAGRRAKTVATDILPFSVAGAESISLPLLETMPLTQVNTDQLFNQGGAGNLNALPAISPDPSVTFPTPPAPVQLPTLPMPRQPALPQPYQTPSWEDVMNMALPLLEGGFGGF